MQAPEHPKRRGRPQAAAEKALQARIIARLTNDQRSKYERLGGVDWLRRKIDAEPEPSPFWRIPGAGP